MMRRRDAPRTKGVESTHTRHAPCQHACPRTHVISPRPRRALAGSAGDDPQHAAARPERSRAGQAQPLLDGHPTRAPQRGRRPVRQGQRLLPGLPRLRGRARVRRAPRQAHPAGTAILTMAAYQAHPARAPCTVTHAPTHPHPRIRATHSHSHTTPAVRLSPRLYASSLPPHPPRCACCSCSSSCLSPPRSSPRATAARAACM